MEENKFEHLIMAGSRDNCDSADIEEMYLWVTEVISDHQTRYKHVAVAAALYQKYKFYERDGKKSAKSYLRSMGYSKGTISHLLKYGEFIILMGFEPHQIPPESVVRAILTENNKDRWRQHYTAACQKHNATKSTQETCSNGGSVASRVVGALNAETDVSTASECDADDEEGGENNAVMVGGANPPDRNDNSEEDEAESPCVDSEDQVSRNPIWDHIPTVAEIRDVLNEFRRNDPNNIYLPSIGESMSRQTPFTGALKIFKEKFTSVALLCHAVKDFKYAGGTLSSTDTDAIKQLCESIHNSENERLEKAINDESDADEGGDPVEKAADDDGEEK